MIEFSSNPAFTGKPTATLEEVEGETRRVFRNEEGEKISIGYGWVNLSASLEQIFEIIHEGRAIAPKLNSANGKEGNRCADNFDSCELLMIDIDNGMRLDELNTHPYYQKFGSGFYTSSSHKPEHHKFRVLFVLAEKITSAEDMRLLYQGVMRRFKFADAVCKDGARLFYGSKGCEFQIRDKKLTKPEIQKLLQSEKMIQIREENEAQAKSKRCESDQKELTQEQRNRIVKVLKHIYVGEYGIWRNIGWGLKSGGFSVADFVEVTQGMMNKKTARDAATVWDACKQNKITMGTVFHFIKKVSPESYSTIWA